MKERPAGVTIISLLVILLGIWTFCAGLVAFSTFGVRVLGSIFGFGGPGLGFISLFSTIWGLVTIIFGWGLWRMQYWAWLGAVIVLGIKILFALFALFGPAGLDWIGTIVSLIVLVYLLTPNARLSFVD